MREKAKELYNSGMSLADIAEEIGVSPGTVRSWKSRYKWDTESATQRCNVASKKSSTKKVIENNNLTDRQQLFCLFFIQSFNATRSYQKAFPDAKLSTAKVEGGKLLKKPAVKKQIEQLKAEKYTRAFLTEDDIFQRYMDIAFSDLGDFVVWGREEIPVMGAFGPVMIKDPDTGEEVTLMKEVNVVNFKDSTELDTYLLSEVKQGKDGASIKLQDRMKALEWLAKHMNLATEEEKARIDNLRSRTSMLRDSTLDLEDMSDTDEMIYGDDDED